MYKYTNIKAVMNYVPQGLMEEMTEPEIIKAALRGYKSNIHNVSLRDETKFCITEIKDHTASLPVGLKQILDATYSKNMPTPDTDDSISENSSTLLLRTDFNGRTITIFQAMLYYEVFPTTEGMRFVGQDSDVVHNQCKNLLCSDCINYSISRSLDTVTTDVREGWMCILYTCQVQNEDGDYMIPMDTNLLTALGYWIEAENWKERSYRKEQGAEQMFQTRMMNAINSFDEFHSKNLLRNLDVGNWVHNTQGSHWIPKLSHQITRINYRA